MAQPQQPQEDPLFI